MAEITKQITVEELRKMLEESNLSAEMKTAYGEVLGIMTDDEKNQLIAIIQEKKKAEEDFEENAEKRNEQLAKLNLALEKHLANTLRDEVKLIREDFEKEGKKDEEKEMEKLENELDQL